uniref:RING-type domain-containing protein n=1 Tax=Ciona savignyi TaxID=51511 RepID=H2YE69_CIOSA
MNLIYCVFCAFMLVSVNGLTELTTDETNGRYSYYGAIVQFQYTDSQLDKINLGSIDSDDEVGRYGYHSPITNVSGQIVYAMATDGIRDGCRFDYSSINLPSSWIALVSRGNCTFADKIDNAANWNASGIIIYDLEKNDELTTMSHEDSAKIVSVIIKYDLGLKVGNLVLLGTPVNCLIETGKKHSQSSGFQLERTSIIFVSVSFMILMLVSLAWLIFYYIQRFRILQAHNRGLRHRNRLAQRAISQLKCRTLKTNDESLSSDSVCAICIENYKVGDVIRELPCQHLFHKKCVDPWLHNKHTCPMCKINIIKTTGNCEDSDSGHFNEGHTASVSSVDQDVELQAIMNSVQASPTTSSPPTDEPEQPHFFR